MKPRTFTLTSLSCVLVLGLALSTPLQAEDSASTEKPKTEKKAPKYPKRYDTNKDGIITEDEIAAGKAADKAKRDAKRQADLEKADRDAEREAKRLEREAKKKEQDARKAEREAQRKERAAQKAEKASKQN